MHNSILNFLVCGMIFSMLLPVAAQYISSGLLLVYTLAVWFWRRLQKDLNVYPTSHNIIEYKVKLAITPLIKAAVVLVSLTLLSSSLSWFFSDYPKDNQKYFLDVYHLLAKQGAFSIALVLLISNAYKQGWRIEQVLKPFCVFMVLYFIYLVIQRYTGADWVHGFSAVLLEHRYAYGVYRLSGFMGHPLSFAYCLLLVVSLCYSLITLKQFSQQYRVILLTILSLSCLALLISGSRWPTLILILLLLVFEHRRLWRWRKGVAGFIVAFGVFIWLEGSLLGRLGELYNSASSIGLNEQRLTFWQIHLKMFMDHPLLGVGYPHRNLAALDYYSQAGYTNIERKYSAHNIFLQTLADSGLIGFAGLLAIIFGCYLSHKILLKTNKDHGVGFLLCVLILSGLMKNNLRDTEFIYSFWLTLSLLIAHINYSTNKDSHERSTWSDTNFKD